VSIFGETKLVLGFLPDYKLLPMFLILQSTTRVLPDF
jgi:hypothetical protein